jgi:tetratricopeptide (TPR) repeat protein
MDAREDYQDLDGCADFATLLQHLMARAQRRDSHLARLTAIPARTIEKWRRGEVSHPRHVADVLKLAQALALDATEATQLLEAAGHPSLAALRQKAQETPNPTLTALLEVWPLVSPATRTDAGAGASAALAQRHQLRPPVADFTGRAQETAELVVALLKAVEQDQGAIISGVQGMGGVGKSELAYRVAHQLRDTFPDAQLVLDLRGTHATPLSPMQALQQVIHAFTPSVQLPDDLPALERHYRSLLHGLRVLILADDARDAAQVRLLLPPAGSVLLITSRTRFTLPGMASVQLEQLSEEEAVTLLRSICARLSLAEAQAIARACGYLPLALRVSGGMLHNDPALDVATYIQQLTDERQRLSRLRDPDDMHLDVEASLLSSYAQLEAASQQVFRHLGVLITDFSSELAQAVVAVGEGVDVRASLHGLLRRNLVMYDRARDRWRLHDLVRDVAVQQLEAAGEAAAARWRYAEAAVARAAQMQEQYLAGGHGALAAFDAERPHIDATIRWAQGHAETLAGDQLLLDTALATRHMGFLCYDPRQERIPLWDGARTAARRLGDRQGEGIALNNLGIAYYELGELQTAISYHEQHLAIVREIGYRQGEGIALGNLGIVYRELGELQAAISYYEQHLSIVRDLGDRRGEGVALGNLGIAYYELGELQTAITYYEQALTIARAIGDRLGENAALNNLGNVYAELGDSGRAIAACTEALAIAREIGYRRTEGYALSYLARAQAQQGDIAQAMTTFAQALDLLHEFGDRSGEAHCQWLFGLALVQQGEREQALPLLRATVAYEQEIGHAKAAEHTALLAWLEARGELRPDQIHQGGREAAGRTD